MEDYCSLDKKRRLRGSCPGQPVDSVLASAASNCFPGSRTMLNFGAFTGLNRSGDSYIHSLDLEENASDYFEEYFNQPEKKHRLSIDQVRFLEKNFVEDNRLEPERKIKLAKELNLQPRQITIWFQNRRARSRTKQLETDYETLHENYTKLKDDYDNILKENERLKSELLCLKHDGSEKGDLEKSSEEKFPRDMPEDDISGMILPEDEETKELTLAKSDVTDGESPQIQYFHLESGDSSQVFELDQSDALQFTNFLKSGDGSCDDSFYYGLPLEDQQQALNFWSY